MLELILVQLHTQVRQRSRSYSCGCYFHGGMLAIVNVTIMESNTIIILKVQQSCFVVTIPSKTMISFIPRMIPSRTHQLHPKVRWVHRQERNRQVPTISILPSARRRSILGATRRYVMLWQWSVLSPLRVSFPRGIQAFPGDSKDAHGLGIPPASHLTLSDQF